MLFLSVLFLPRSRKRFPCIPIQVLHNVLFHFQDVRSSGKLLLGQQRFHFEMLLKLFQDVLFLPRLRKHSPSIPIQVLRNVLFHFQGIQSSAIFLHGLKQFHFEIQTALFQNVLFLSRLRKHFPSIPIQVLHNVLFHFQDVRSSVKLLLGQKQFHSGMLIKLFLSVLFLPRLRKHSRYVQTQVLHNVLFHFQGVRSSEIFLHGRMIFQFEPPQEPFFHQHE